MLLRSLGFGKIYGVDELPTEVLNLFMDLSKNPEKHVEFSPEIISAGLQGKIDFGRDFDLDAYECRIRQNLMLNKDKRRKKELFIDFNDSGDDWDEVAASGGIKANNIDSHAVRKMEDAYEELLLEEELKYAVDTIKSLQPVLLVEAKVDFITAMRQALKGVPESINAVKRVCDEYAVVAEQVKLILDSSYEFNTLFC